ncbi:MAG: hypothetical protein QM715_07755 [Nibricoccus sp.]
MKFRLKPKVPPPEASPAETPVPFSNPPIPPAPTPPPAAAIPPAPMADMPPPEASVPVPRPPSAKPTPVFRPPTSLMTPQHLPTPRALSDLPPASPSPPAPLPTSAPPERTIKADKWLAGVVVLVLVLAGATYGVRELLKANPKPKAVGKPAAAASEEKPANPDPSAATTAAPAKPLPGSQTKLVEKPTSAAGKAIAQARDAVTAVEQRERTAGTTGLLNEPAPTATPAPAAPERPQNILTPDTPPRTPIVEEVTTTQAEPAVPPSAPFRQFVVNLRVNGVFQGENPRAMLNGRMYNVGAEVDPKLAITLFKIEPEAKLLIFRDDTGAVLSRRY